MRHLSTLIQHYKKSYLGIGSDIWFLSVVVLINRSGTMVIPFMSLYLTEKLSFSLTDAGFVLSAFGVGSLFGAYTGGILSDKVGFKKVQFYSLFISGFLFIFLDSFSDLQSILIYIFILSFCAEMFRPANSSAISFHADPSKLTQSFSINRLAINLGFSIGPALGGFLASQNYHYLFIVDGVTNILAALALAYFYFYKSKLILPKTNLGKIKNSELLFSAFKDKKYMIFILLTSLNAIIFFQLFSTFPVFIKTNYLQDESIIGLLFTINGILVVVFEMPLVQYLQNRKLLKLIAFGTILTGISYLITSISDSFFLVYLTIILLTFGEIFTMPFMLSYAVSRSTVNTRGRFLSLYTMAYSIAHISAPFIGTQIVNKFSYQSLWIVMALLSVIVSYFFYRMSRE